MAASTDDSDINKDKDEEYDSCNNSDDGTEVFEDTESEDDETTEKSIHKLRGNYNMYLKEYKPESDNTTYIDAIIKNSANADIGSMEAYLFNRRNMGYINLWSEIKYFPEETRDVALFFTLQNGRLKYDRIDGLDEESDKLASSRGGFLVVEEVRLDKEERGKDLSLDMMETLLDHLGARWTIAWVKPFILTRDSKDQSEEEIHSGNIALARHFARLGFMQASAKEYLKSCSFWYLIPGRRTRKSKQDVKNLPVVFEKYEGSDKSTDKESILVDAVLAGNGNVDHLKKITLLVMDGENIDKSEALFHAIAQKSVGKDNLVVVEHLLHLGADISYKNKYGASPLHVAAQHLSAKSCQLLLSLGADKDVRDVNVQTPFEGAIGAIESINELYTTFDLNKIRVRKFEERCDALVTLHLLSRNPLNLIEGILTPRMFFRLQVTAEISADVCENLMPQFENRIPMSYEDASLEIHLLEEVPKNEVPKEIYKSYAWGWQQQLQAIANIMRKGLLPTDRRVQEELRYSGSDWRYNKYYKEKGGNLFHGLVALVETARHQSEREGDGYFEDVHGEDLYELPAVEHLDDDFLFVHYFFVSYCVTPGAALVIPEIKISPSAKHLPAPGSDKADTSGVKRPAPGSPKAGPSGVKRCAKGLPPYV